MAEIEKLRTPKRMELLEVDRVVDLCLEGIQVANVLDVGTGSGIFAEAFFTRGKSTTGIDPNPEMLKAAKEILPTGTFLQGTVEKIPLKDKSFDLVFLGHVLHESDNILQALTETKRVAKQKVCVLEWPYTQEEQGPPLEHRLRTEEILKAAKQAGFSSDETFQMQQMILTMLKI
jgi:ubiquinone/menaquinone biosynthesis C-methylase UbiE